MAEARRNRIERMALAALCLGAAAAAFAQPNPAATHPQHSIQIQSPQTGSLTGRLTDLHSAPLAGVAVVARNRATGAAAQTITAKNGAFRFAQLEAGEYTLEADAPQLGHGLLERITVTGGMEARVQAAMRFEPPTPALLEATAPTEIAAAARAAPMRLPASAPETAPRPALDTSSPPAAASIAAVPLQALPVRPQAALPSAPGPSLETESAGVPPALAIAQPRALELAAGFAPAHPTPAAGFAPAHPTPAAGFAPARPTLAAAASAMQAVIELSQSPFMAAAQRADPAAAAVATTITAEQLQALPASGRHWQEFLEETPAASASADSGQASFRASEGSAEVTIDGVSTRLAFGVAAGSGSRADDAGGEGAERQSSMSGWGGQSWTGGRGFNVSEAAIHEVTTVAGNVEAEGLRSAGGRTAIRTESGANELHGQVFLFDRQNTWGAQNPFTKLVQFTGFSTTSNYSSETYTPPDHETAWGLGLGSRIRRDRIFWFGALDGNRRNDPGLATVKMPDEFFAQPSNAQAQLLSAQLGLSNANPVAEGLAAYSGMMNTLNSLLGPAPRTAAQWVGFARIDWQAAERHHFTLEGIGADWNAPGGGLTRVSETYGSHSFGSSQASQQWLLARWEAYVTPNLLAVTQGSAGRAILSARPETPSAFEEGFLNNNAWGQLPQIVVDSRYGFTIGNPTRFGQGSYPDERLYQGQEMVDWAHKKLLVKGGFELAHNADTTSLLRNETGTYYYSKAANFIADALAFERFGPNPSGVKNNGVAWHNCDPTGKAWTTTTGTPMGLGALPCYSYYSQTIGPSGWHLSTNDWAGYATAQWQPGKWAVFSAGLRWEREQLPPPIAELDNPELPATEKLPSLGNNLGPRLSLAIGSGRGHLPVLRLGYGIYYGRTENATLETALTQTGSLNGDLNFFIRPTDGLNPRTVTSSAPLFPDVLTGTPGSVVVPGAVEFAANFRNSEVHQAVAALEQTLPEGVQLTAGAMLSLGRRLPVSMDTNIDPSVNPGKIIYAVKDPTGEGPIKAPQITVPFYASWPSATSPNGTAGRLYSDYQQIAEIMSRANSTYEAAMVKIVRNGRRGLSLHAHYTYAHAMDWNPNESTLVAGSDVLDPANFKEEYGTSNLDVRHSAAVMAIFESPWKLRDFAGRLGNGWTLSGTGEFRSGLPYTMRTTGSLPEEFDKAGNAIVGLGPGMNGSGGDNRIYWMDSSGQTHTIGRNTFRYPNAWKADMRLGKRFDLGESRQLELMVESFNLLNHQNVTELETAGYSIESGDSAGGLPTLCYLTINATTGNAGCGSTTTTGSTPIAAFGQPLNINATNFYRERQIEIGLRMRF